MYLSVYYRVDFLFKVGGAVNECVYLRFMMLWTVMCESSSIVGTLSSLGWLNCNAGNFHALGSEQNRQIFFLFLFFFQNRSSSVAELPVHWCWVLEDHMTCSKVPPICHLKELHPEGTIETEVINKWYTKEVGPVRQIGRSLLFLWRSLP